MTEFVYPSSVRFECQQCGDCCRSWEVALSTEERDALERLEWHDVPGFDEVEKTRRVGTGKKGQWVLGRNAEGHCVFLSPDNRCRVHEQFGESAKPLMCRMYPFGFRRIGAHIGVDVAFSCRSVGEGTGQVLETRKSEWLRLIQEQATDARLPRMSVKYPMEADLVWEFEHHLISFLQRTDLPLIRRLWCVHEYMKLATTGDPSTQAAATLRGAIKAALPDQLRVRPLPLELDKTEQAIVGQWLYLVLNPVPVGFQQWTASARNKTLRSRDAQAGAFMKRAAVTVDNQHVGYSFEEIESLPAGFLLSAACEEMLSNYLSSKILGQRFLEAGDGLLSFQEAIPRWLFGYSTLLFAARWSALDAGSAEVEKRDLLRAVHLVDRTMGRLSLSPLNRTQRKAWDFVLLETDAPISAAARLLPATPEAGEC